MNMYRKKIVANNNIAISMDTVPAELETLSVKQLPFVHTNFQYHTV